MPIIAFMIFLLLTPIMALYVAMGLARSPSYWRKYLPFFVLAIFMVAYTYHPPYEMDLTRYFDIAREMSKYKSFDKIINYGNQGLFVRDLLFWFVGKTGDVQLLPAITTSTVYGVAAYITCDAASDLKRTKYIPFILLMQLLLLPLISIISNIRNVFAFSLILLAVYLDIVKSRRSVGVLMLYILPCFIHQAGIALVLVRLILIFLERSQWLVIAATLLFPSLIRFAYAHIDLFGFGGIMGDLLQTAIRKVYNYWETDSISDYEKQVLTGRYSRVQRLFMISFAVIMIGLLLYELKQNLANKKWHKFNAYVFLVCIMVVACSVFIAPHYWRFYSAVVIVCGPALLPLLPLRNARAPLLLQALKYSLVVFTFGGFLVNARGIVLSSDHLDWLASIMLSNPYTILFGVLRNIW